MKLINDELLYGNESNAIALCEYSRELKLTKRLIDIAISLIDTDTTPNSESQNGICNSFAKTIVRYSKAAYDNMLIGHFHAARMLLRSSLENLVCLELLHKHENLWKYYLVHCCWQGLRLTNRIPTEEESRTFQEIYKEYNISEEFFVKRGKKEEAYIDRPYGWTYQVNPKKNFTFRELCNITGYESEYSSFQLLSIYSHGTTYYLKMGDSVFNHDVIPIFCEIFVNLNRTITILEPESKDKELSPVVVELQELLLKWTKKL